MPGGGVSNVKLSALRSSFGGIIASVLAACTNTVAPPTNMASPPPADVVVRGGPIRTMNPAQPVVQAVAIRDGKIVALGDERTVQLWTNKDTRIIDLAGRMAMPGLNDSHVHLEMAALDLVTYACEFEPTATLDVLLATVKQCAEGKSADAWIVGQYIGSNLYTQIRDASTIKRLDEASGGRPVFLRNDSIHDRWVNSRALQIAGYTRDTKDPLNGQIGRDPKTGELNGLLIERPAYEALQSQIPAFMPLDDERRRAAIATSVRTLNSFGVTAFQDARINPDGAAVIHELDQQGSLTARANLSTLVEPNKNPSLDQLFAQRAAFRSERLNLDWAKIYLDGVMVSRTALFIEPYLPDDEHGADFRGEAIVSQARLNQILAELDRRGISVKLHVAGDGSVHQAIEAIAETRKANGPNGPLHSLAHAGYILDSDIARLKPLGIAIDTSPTVWYPGSILTATEEVIGVERAGRFWPFRTMLDQGALVAGGTDWKTLPGEFSDIWSGIEGMVTRRNPRTNNGPALWAEQAITLDEALRIFTLDAARAMKLDDRTGSLAVGKSADLIVLAQDIFAIPPERISDTLVDYTLFEGEIVYNRNEGAKGK